ncbi:TnsA endonuclease N-terminal domain-containing protein [Pseudomonas sp. NPDC086251]|uniref:TnsA endonuclease N-terminal domain-containing protein n=1 Tax=Pseudomonas sp. NPDC086251 TaxID=3364431 RepID=UPI0038381B77
MNPSSPSTRARVSFNPSRVKKLTTAYIDQKIRAGLGQGVLGEYQPWLQITSFASRGSSRVTRGVKIPRTHHTLSDSEYEFLVLVEFNPDVIDIREQFPLLEYFETHAIAISKNIRPALYPQSSVPHVYTTDFMLTMKGKDGGTFLHGVSLKYKQELKEANKRKRLRIFEKLEVEEEYWTRRNISWDSLYYEDFPYFRIKNLIMIRGYAAIKPSLAVDKNIKLIIRYFTLLGPHALDKISLSVLLHKIAKYLYILYADVKALFFYMVWHHIITIDLDSHVITMARPVTILPECLTANSVHTGVSLNESDQRQSGTDAR